ncbi:phage tail protein [Cellulosilyticum ruminicola]|uniref:phage tail protein n=1 Tax=Cellulosilyticum ruminicola TaxID=425254 RepID=UPI0006CFFEB6|nr:phage tail protein [Cellulosilyticum ruminicola]
MYSVDQEMKYFNTSPHLLKEGISHSFLNSEIGTLNLQKAKQRGYYFLKAIDSEIEGMTWNRLKISDLAEGEVLREIYILATDSPFGELAGEMVDYEEVLQSTTREPKEKISFLVSEGAKVYNNHQDILLHHFEGRYLWVAISCYTLAEKEYILQGLEVEYPMQTFVDYLPEIYAEGGEFLRRYMGIFQSLYLDIEREIDQLPKYLDADTAPERFLNELGKWVGLDNSKGIFNINQMRTIIPKATLLNSGKGTKRTLEQMIRLYTGIKPVIVEYFEWSNLIKDERIRKIYKKLYGSTSSHFTVILEVGESNTPINQEKLQILIDQYKPAMTQAHLVILQKAQRSDWHSYLGVNSYLADYKTAKLDGMQLTGEIMLQLK